MIESGTYGKLPGIVAIGDREDTVELQTRHGRPRDELRVEETGASSWRR
jgi:hypothetical protein